MMRRWHGRIALVAMTTLAISACATRGDVRRAVAEARTQMAEELDAESQARRSADQQLETQMNQLRNDLQGLRTEFGTRITAMEEGIRFMVPVHFAFDDATVRSEDYPVIERFAEVAQRHYPGAKITVEGFADPAGSQRYNMELSRRRAEAVRAELANRGLAGGLVEAVGYGKTRLVVPGAQRDDAGAEMNRRVVFVIETRGSPMDVVAVLSSLDGE